MLISSTWPSHVRQASDPFADGAQLLLVAIRGLAVGDVEHRGRGNSRHGRVAAPRLSDFIRMVSAWYIGVCPAASAAIQSGTGEFAQRMLPSGIRYSTSSRFMRDLPGGELRHGGISRPSGSSEWTSLSPE